MRTYELTFIIDPQLEDTLIDQRVEKTTNFLVAHGAQVLAVERWGTRKLAYDIRKRSQGYYALIRFKADGSITHPIGRELRLDEGILRHMVIATEEPATSAKK